MERSCTGARIKTTSLLLACLTNLANAAISPEPAELHKVFVASPADARIMMRWWWFGPGVMTGDDKTARCIFQR